MKARLLLTLLLAAASPAVAEVPADLLAENEARTPFLVRVEALEASWLLTESGYFPLLQARARTAGGEAVTVQVLDPAWSWTPDAWQPAPLPGRAYFVWLEPQGFAATVLPVLEGETLAWRGHRMAVAELQEALGRQVPLEAIADPALRLEVAEARLERRQLRGSLAAVVALLRVPDASAAWRPPAAPDGEAAFASAPDAVDRSPFGLWMGALSVLRQAAFEPDTSTAAREGLRSLLDLPDPHRALAVALVLAELGDDAGRAVLERAFAADDFALGRDPASSWSLPGRSFAEGSRASAAHALALLGDLRGLESPDVELRLAAAAGAAPADRARVERALADLRARTAAEVRGLSGLAAPRQPGDYRERYPREWIAVRAALARLGDDGVLAELVEAVLEQERTWPVQDEVTSGVRMQVQTWTPASRQWPSLVGAVLGAELERPALVQRLQGLPGGPEVAALLAAPPPEPAEEPPAPLESIRERVKDPDPSRRAEGWAAAGRHRVADLFDATLAAALGTTGQERKAAMFGLALYGRALPPEAMRRLLQDGDPKLRLAALEIATARPSGLEPAELVAVARDLDRTLSEDFDRRSLAQWLSRLARLEPEPAFLAAMQDPEPRVRRLFVKAASRAGNPALREALRTALDDADPEVRESAGWGLGLLDAHFPP